MKLVTFNIRCSWDKDGINNFLHRAGSIAYKINEEKPDIICFQECTEKIVGMLKSILPQYHIVFNQRNADFRGEGLAVALNKETTDLLGLEFFWLSPTPNLPGSRYEEQSNCPRICQCAVVRNGNTVFRVYNVHLDHRSDPARRLGMEATLKRVREDLNKISLPFFILGDFNAVPESEPVALCKNNPYADLQELTEEIQYTFHLYGEKPAPYKIDYVFADSDTAKKPFTIRPWAEESDGIYLSDHYPIALDITL